MTMQANLAFHELSSIAPLLEGEAFDELVADIRQHGLLEPIVLLDGRILDGRNRYHACQEAGAELKTVDWNGEAGDALDYVVSQNVIRRHLRPSQKGTVAAKIANLKHGGDRGNQYTGGKGSRDPLPNGSDAAEFISMAEAARRVGVGEATVKRARFVLEHGTPEQVVAVEAGQLTVATAARKFASGAGRARRLSRNPRLRGQAR